MEEKMTQDVDQPYQPQTKKSQINIPKRLRLLAIEMRDVAQELIDNAQDRHWLDHAEELKGAADICLEWAKDIKKNK